MAVEGRPSFYLTFFAPQDKEGRPLANVPHYSTLVERYNSQQGDSLLLRLNATQQALSSEQIEELNKVLALPEEQGNANYYLRRGIVYSLLQDYEQAISDYGRVLALDGRNVLALFARSLASSRYSEAKTKGREGEERSESLNTRLPSILPSSMQDLGQVLMLAPDFAYAYYNRAVIYAQQGERREAIADYSRAIEIQPRLAEAYYNRGLLRLAEGATQEGVQDLSRAGELGLYDAYNIIKRMN